MFVMSFLSDVFPRVFRFRAHGLLALIIIAVGLGICALVGLWAGKVAQGKGREFGVFFALGFLLAICGIIPGLIVVIIAYAISPAPAQGQAASRTTLAPGMPPPGSQSQAPPPQTSNQAQPPSAPATPGDGPVTPSPQGGYEYVPPPAVPATGVPPPPPPPPPPPTERH